MIAAGARPWLPANAVRDTVLTSALTAYAERWATRWFASPKPTSIRMAENRNGVGLANNSICWAHPAGGLLLTLAPNAHIAMSGAMLGLDVAAHKLLAHDHAILRDLAAVSARDFVQNAAPLFGLEPRAETTSAREVNCRFRYALSVVSASQLMELYVDEHLAIAARRALVRSSSDGGAPLTPRGDAIARQTIQVGAMIGVGKLGLGDLRSLAHGDVLVLDRGPRDALALAIDGAARPEAFCSIAREGDDLKIQINAMQDGGHV